ncbi:hypothetical protein R3P38DRAFT_3581287 [Favolaschia claudopus]|uniref:Uncharacterized protein n=1 Tax=Favolaschia claudopus TaxID=2862362 RepID=A0AAW0AJY0_9AGAR
MSSTPQTYSQATPSMPAPALRSQQPRVFTRPSWRFLAIGLSLIGLVLGISISRAVSRPALLPPASDPWLHIRRRKELNTDIVVASGECIFFTRVCTSVSRRSTSRPADWVVKVAQQHLIAAYLPQYLSILVAAAVHPRTFSTAHILSSTSRFRSLAHIRSASRPTAGQRCLALPTHLPESRWTGFPLICGMAACTICAAHSPASTSRSATASALALLPPVSLRTLPLMLAHTLPDVSSPPSTSRIFAYSSRRPPPRCTTTPDQSSRHPRNDVPLNWRCGCA